MCRCSLSCIDLSWTGPSKCVKLCTHGLLVLLKCRLQQATCSAECSLEVSRSKTVMSRRNETHDTVSRSFIGVTCLPKKSLWKNVFHGGYGLSVNASHPPSTPHPDPTPTQSLHLFKRNPTPKAADAKIHPEQNLCKVHVFASTMFM